jgi:TolB-like protein
MPEKAPGAVQEKPSIAALPFDDISPDKDQEYFVLGLSEEILNYISRIPNLNVTSKQSSFIFKDSAKTIKEIAEILERDYILEGSVRKAGNALRITAQLIRAKDDSHLWSETYDRELKDIFEIQEDIAINVADKLKLTLESLKLLGGTENIEAYEKYLIAKGLRSTNVAMTRKALGLIDSAIDLDPEFALAYTEKAHKHYIFSLFGPYKHFLAEKDDALKEAQKSIELEPDLGDGYMYLGYFKEAKKEWVEAKSYYQNALELIDEPLSGRHNFMFNFHLGTGELKRAYELLEKMRRNDPFNQGIVSNYYVIHTLLGDRQRAEKEYQRRNKLLLKGYADWHDDAITEVRLYSG